MMNKQQHIDPELHSFVVKDRARLFVERNEFKQLAEDVERDYITNKCRSRNVILVLMAVIVLLLGVLAYGPLY